MTESEVEIDRKDEDAMKDASLNGGARPPPISKKFAVAIHALIESCQSEHGLRHDDYAQYRAYCTRRLSRLRHNGAVRKDLTHGPAAGHSSSKGKKFRHAYQPRHWDDDDTETVLKFTKHENFLLVSLFCAERAWSHAMEIKALYDASLTQQKKKNKQTTNSASPQSLLPSGSEKSKSSPGKIRRHYMRRLKKATTFATELERRAKIAGTQTTAVEARAYAAWMRANWSLEAGDWQTACTEYNSAMTICRAIGNGETLTDEQNYHHHETEKQTKEDLELRDFFTARAEHVIAPVLRYCQYELQEGGMDQADLESLMKSQEDAETELMAKNKTSTSSVVATFHSAQLKSKLDSMRDHELHTQATGGSMATIHFRSKDVPVENRELRVALLKVADLRSEWEKSSSSNNEEQLTAHATTTTTEIQLDDAKFMALLNSYDDAISIVSDDLKEYVQMKTGPAVNERRSECRSLLGYLQNEKLKLRMGRNERFVQDIIAAQTLSSSSSLPNDNGSDALDFSSKENKRLEEIAHLYDALLQDARAIAKLPGGNDANNDDDAMIEDEFVLEANANVLRLRALRCYYIAQMYATDVIGKYAEAAALFRQASSLASQASEEIAACQDMEHADDLIEAMEDLETKIVGAKCRADACAYINRSKGGASSLYYNTLLWRLDDFHMGAADDTLPALATVPPALELLPCKPTFFDLALNHVGQLPLEDLQLHIDAYRQSKGILSWFRRS